MPNAEWQYLSGPVGRWDDRSAVASDLPNLDAGQNTILARHRLDALLRPCDLPIPFVQVMCAALLHLKGYEEIDPQHPLGGPDGLKDVLCKKGGKKWVAAAFFPATLPKVKDIKNKFIHDLAGIAGNNAEATAFFVNQHLTIGEREELRSRLPNHEVEIYHFERIRDLLDFPKGCGIRLEYLRILMTEEEQWAFWHVMNTDVVRRLADN